MKSKLKIRFMVLIFSVENDLSFIRQDLQEDCNQPYLLFIKLFLLSFGGLVLLLFMQSLDLHPSVKAIRATQLGILVSIVLVFVKAISGYFGDSYALIADATESGVDIISSGLLWMALRIALKPADEEHPYGHGKAEPLAAILISLFLIGAAGWIAWHSIVFIETPHEIPKKFTLIVLLAVILIKESLFRYVLRVGKSLNSQAVQADAFHHRSDAITSVAAFIGITIAVIGGKGYEQADDWAALLACCFILYNAFGIIRPALDEIMDKAPSSEVADEVRQLTLKVEGVKGVEKCFVRKMGLEYYVDLHIEVEGKLTVEEGHEIAHRVKDEIMHANNRIKNVLIHVEPYGHHHVVA